MTKVTSSLRIGILAEDRSDCDTVEVLVRRVLNERVGIRHRAQNGCARLMRKAAVWMAEMADEGCTALLFVHDRDRKDEALLRRGIEAIEVPARARRHICIPVEELEAWFFSDPEVLEQLAPGQGRGKALSSPHALPSPKEALMRLSASVRHGKSIYTPQLGKELARGLNLELCARRCPSFGALRAFLLEL